MTHTAMKLAALGVLGAFLAILVWHVPRPDLGGVVAITFALAGWDFFGGRR